MAIAIRQIATGTTTLGNATSVSATLTTPVLDTSKAFVLATWQASASLTSPSTSIGTVELVDASTVTFTRAAATTAANLTIRWTVVEAWEGISVQRGTFTLASSPQAIALPAPVAAANTFLLNTYQNAGTGWTASAFIGWELGSAGTEINFYSNSVANTQVVAWQAVSIEGARVERGNLAQSVTTTISENIPVNNVVAGKSFPLVSWTSPAGTAANLGQKLFRTRLGVNSPHPLLLNRQSSGTTYTAYWEVVVLPDGFAVQDGVISLTGVATTGTVTLATAVQEARCLTFLGGFQNTGASTPYTTAADFTVAAFRATATAPTTVTAVRSGAVNTSITAVAQAIEFPAPVPQPTLSQSHALAPFTATAYQPNSVGSVNRTESIANPPVLTQIGTISLSQGGSFAPTSYRLLGIGQVNGAASYTNSAAYVIAGIRQEIRLSETPIPIAYPTAKVNSLPGIVGLAPISTYSEPATLVIGQVPSFSPLSFQPNTSGSVNRTTESALPVLYSSLGSETATRESLVFTPLQYFAIGLREVNPNAIPLESFAATGYAQVIAGLSNILPSSLQAASYFAFDLSQQYGAIVSNQSEYASIASRLTTYLLSANIPLGYPPTALTLTYFSLSFTGVAMATIALLQAPVISVFGRAVSRGSTNALMSGSQDAKIELGRREVD